MNFRSWLREKWFQHLEECAVWHSQASADINSYFRRYKWWLKRQYQQQIKKGPK